MRADVLRAADPADPLAVPVVILGSGQAAGEHLFLHPHVTVLAMLLPDRVVDLRMCAVAIVGAAHAALVGYRLHVCMRADIRPAALAARIPVVLLRLLAAAHLDLADIVAVRAGGHLIGVEVADVDLVLLLRVVRIQIAVGRPLFRRHDGVAMLAGSRPAALAARIPFVLLVANQADIRGLIDRLVARLAELGRHKIIHIGMRAVAMILIVPVIDLLIIHHRGLMQAFLRLAGRRLRRHAHRDTAAQYDHQRHQAGQPDLRPCRRLPRLHSLFLPCFPSPGLSFP